MSQQAAVDLIINQLMVILALIMIVIGALAFSTGYLSRKESEERRLKKHEEERLRVRVAELEAAERVRSGGAPCRNCGVWNGGEAKFCLKCGKPLC